MSAILGVFQADGRPVTESVVRRMLSRMRRRGADRVDVWRDGGALLAVARHEWESGPAISGPALVAREDDRVVAADASVYHRDDLRRRLAAAGVRPTGPTASHLILAAYRAWGDGCAAHLEGDFAFVLWDRKLRRVLCARDFTGTRPLFHLEAKGTLVVASAAGAILEHPDSPRELNLGALGVDAAGLVFAISDETCYQGVRELDAGTTLDRPLASPARVITHWAPPLDRAPRRTSFDEGADELRALLATAVAERLDPAAPSCVWMSGGRDSTAIFASGHHAARQGLAARGPISISARLPAADPGCENDMIESAAARWGVTSRWIDLDAVPLVAEPAAGGRRDEPYAIEYEQFLRALVGESRAAGARVAFNGHGGDLLFSSSAVLMADHLAQGRLLALWREWQPRRHAGGRFFVKWGVEPLLPRSAVRLTSALLGRRLRGHYEHPIPSWIDRRFVRAHALEERGAACTLHGTRGDRTLHEMRWLLTRRHFPRVMRTLGGYGLDGGIETRAPLMDRRVIDFALSRPASDRRIGADTKRLLRHAMRGLLPEPVLAARPYKTGTFRGYFLSHFAAIVPLLRHCARTPVLAELGIVDGTEFRRTVERYANRSPGVVVGPSLLTTLLVELWLRAGSHAAGPARVGSTAATPVGSPG